MHTPYLVRVQDVSDYYYIKVSFTSLIETDAKRCRPGLKEGCFCNYHQLLVQNL